MNRDWTLGLALGALGGIWLVVAAMVVGLGKEILLPWALLVAVTVAFLRGETIRAYTSAFTVTAAAFFFSALILYARVALETGSLGFLGHLQRLGFLVALSVALALPSARLAQRT